MAKKVYVLVFEIEAEIEIDDHVFDVVDDNWRDVFYQLHDEDDIVKHVGYNLLRNKYKLSNLDGWADQPDENANLIDENWELTEIIKEGE